MADEQIDPGIRMGDSAVMLSAAMHLCAQRGRPFAAAQGDMDEGNGVTWAAQVDAYWAQ